MNKLYQVEFIKPPIAIGSPVLLLSTLCNSTSTSLNFFDNLEYQNIDECVQLWRCIIIA